MKIRHKLLLILVATAVVTSALVGVGSMRVLRRAVRERFAERIRAEAAVLAIRAEEGVCAECAEPLAQTTAQALRVRVTLIGADGRVLGDSARHLEDLAGMDNHLGRPEVKQAALEGFGEDTRVSASTGIEYFYSARRVDGPGPVRFVRIALPVAEVQALQSHYFWLVTLVTLGLLLIVAGIAYGVVRQISRPIERMSEAAGKATAGSLEIEVPYEGDDEVAQLARSINRMRRSLVAKIAEVDADRGLMASVFAGMREGLVLLGPDRRIEMANEAFRQIFSVPFDPAGRPLAEAIRNASVHRDLDQALAESREVHDMVLRAPESGRSFEVHATPFTTQAGDPRGRLLVLFFDITRLTALESVRREFVADVSHELRTPLTAIKAFVETLLDEGLHDAENGVRFLEIARKHIDRMEALIDDLTDLSLIETGAVDLAIEDVNVSDLAREVASQIHEKHAALRVGIRVEIPPKFVVRADRRRLEQVLVNLVDNAFKFNRPGGGVTVRASMEGALPVLVVEDTGVGIPADCLDKVFNRFFRVDRARSREMGGTGLGLAIVKHLMRLHGGQIRVESELGHGSRFILEFPAA